MSDISLLELLRPQCRRTSSFWHGAILMLADCISIMGTLCVSFFIINAIDPQVINFHSFINYWVFLPGFLVIFYVVGLYPGLMQPPANEVKMVSICTLFCFAGMALVLRIGTNDSNALDMALGIMEGDYERKGVSTALVLAIPITSFVILIVREGTRKVFSGRVWRGISAVVYINDADGAFIIDRLVAHPEFGYKPVLIVNFGSAEINDYHGIPVRAFSDEVHNTVHALGIKCAIILCGESKSKHFRPMVQEIRARYKHTILVPEPKSILTQSLSMRDFGGIIGFATINNHSKKLNILIKRMIDILLIIIALPLIAFVSVIIALGVKITSRGPVLYGHPRYGKNRRLFKAWKFRTMVTDADKKLEELFLNNPRLREEWERETKLKDDPRITRFGKFLRRTSMDELPQLWNIFIGEMSLIGPRPVTTPEIEKYGELAHYVLSIKPGLSGMWQISGRSNTSYEERMLLDSYYIQNWSIWLDLWILIKTVGVVLWGKGAY
jgi:Undecaprenyl-phosphate galactose phosphotransferase WbaP